MENIFLGKLKNTELTATQRRIAQFCIDNQLSLSQMTLQQLAECAGTSEVSVLNFVRKLGFNGFSDFKQWVYSRITESAVLEGEKNRRNLRERLERSSEFNSSSRIIDDYLQLAVSTIETTLRQNNSAVYGKVADLLSKSDNVYIYGARSTAGCAQRLSIGMQYLLKNVHHITDPSIYQVISNCRKSDTVYFICLSRFFKTDVSLCQMVHERGANLVIVTNSAVAPFAQYADQLLLVNTDSGNFFHSELGIITINEYITHLLTRKYGEEMKENWSFVDSFVDKYRC